MPPLPWLVLAGMIRPWLTTVPGPPTPATGTVIEPPLTLVRNPPPATEMRPWKKPVLIAVPATNSDPPVAIELVPVRFQVAAEATVKPEKL